jgi:hypothetical protein
MSHVLISNPSSPLLQDGGEGDNELNDFDNSFLWEDKEEGRKKILTRVSKIRGEREFIASFVAWGCGGHNGSKVSYVCETHLQLC